MLIFCVTTGLATSASAKPGSNGHGSGHGHTDVLGKPDLRRAPYPSHYPIRSAMGHHA